MLGLAAIEAHFLDVGLQYWRSGADDNMVGKQKTTQLCVATVVRLLAEMAALDAGNARRPLDVESSIFR